MSGLTTDTSNTVLNWLLGKVVVPYSQPMMLRLMTVIGTDDVPGTEVAGDDYEPQEISLGTVASKAALTDAEIIFASLDSLLDVTLVGVEIWDSSLVALRVGWAALAAPVDVLAGEPYSIAAADLLLGIG